MTSAGSDGAASPYSVAHLHHVRRPHYGRWLAAGLILVAFAAVVKAFVEGQISWNVVAQFLTAQAILSGLVNTIVMTFWAMALGIVLGILFAIMVMSPNPVLRSVSVFYIWFFRGTPLLLQLLLWFNLALVLPRLGIPGLFWFRTVDVMTPFVATLLGLGINQGAYTAEVVRGGILSVDRGQSEAAKTIGMTRLTTLRRIVLPQAMRVILPPIGNEVISMVKLTSIASVIQYAEILRNAQTIYFANARVIELLIVAAFWYLAVVTVLSVGQYFIEKHFARGVGTVTQNGSGTLNLSAVNTFTGAVAVLQGTLQTGDSSALGTTNGGTTISSGATLDITANAINLGQEIITISGTGVGGNGALINSSGDSTFVAPNLARMIMAGDLLVGGNGRTDLRSATTANPTLASLSTLGLPRKLTVKKSAYTAGTGAGNSSAFGLIGITVDAQLGDIDVQQGILSIEAATTSLGNVASNITVRPGGTFQMFAATNLINKVFTLGGDGTILRVARADRARHRLVRGLVSRIERGRASKFIGAVREPDTCRPLDRPLKLSIPAR